MGTFFVIFIGIFSFILFVAAADCNSEDAFIPLFFGGSICLVVAFLILLNNPVDTKVFQTTNYQCIQNNTSLVISVDKQAIIKNTIEEYNASVSGTLYIIKNYNWYGKEINTEYTFIKPLDIQ